MAQPYNYMLDVPDPTQQIMSGLQTGLQIGEAFQQREAAQAKQQRTNDMNAALQKLAKNPTAEGYQTLLTTYPELKDALDTPMKSVTEQEKRARIAQAWPIAHALNTGKIEVGKKLIAEQAAAFRNAGDEKNAKLYDDMNSMIDVGVPEAAAQASTLFLANADPENFATNVKAWQETSTQQALAGSQISEAKSKAQKAAVDAKFAESKAVADLQLNDAQIMKIGEEINIAKDNAKLALLNAQRARAKDAKEMEKLDLEIDAKEKERDQKVRDTVAEAKSARFNIDNMQNTINRVKDFYKENGAQVLLNTGPWAKTLPTIFPSSVAFVDDLKSLGSQAFLASLPNMKGFGALSGTEKDALISAFQSFNTDIGSKALKRNVDTAEKLLNKMSESVDARYGDLGTVDQTKEKVEGQNVGSAIPPPVPPPAMPTGFRVLGRE